ncbi:MAG TPA: MarR family transcriptional regulator [Dehalococcoidia bacterium]
MELPEELLKYSDAIDALRALGRVRWAVMDVVSKQVEEQEDIPFDWFEVLIEVVEAPDERIKMTDLARLTLRSKSGATRLADRLEDAGLVRRESSPEDRRAVYLTLTDNGRALFERVRAPVVEILIERFAAHVSPKEARFITLALAKVLKANELEPIVAPLRPEEPSPTAALR